MIAVIIDLIFAEPPSRLHPTVGMGRHISYMKRHCPGRPGRDRALPFLWGALIVLSGVLLWGGAAWTVQRVLTGRLWLSLLILPPLLKASFSLRYLLFSGREIRQALSAGDLNEARRLTSWHLVSRDTSALGSEEISSCVIESLSENITDSFSSPLFYYLLGGLPAAWAYRFINTSDAMIAYRTRELEWLGKTTAWCDSLLNLIPARLTALMIVLAAFIMPHSSGRRAWTVMIGDRRNTASPNAGWTMSAMAGALSVRLEKRECYVLGGAFDLPHANDIDRCLKLTMGALILSFILLTACYGGTIWLLNMAA